MLAARWSAASTGLKMFVIMSLGLLPLGVIAIAASFENAQDNRARVEAEARAVLAVQIQRFTLPLARHAYTLRAARDALPAQGLSEEACRRTLARLAALPASGSRFALYSADGALRCVSSGYVPPAGPAVQGQSALAEITADGQWLRFFLYDQVGALEAIFQVPRETLAALTNSPASPENFGVELVQGERVLVLRQREDGPTLAGEVTVTQPLANDQYEMRVHRDIPPVTLSDGLIIVTPLLMWLWASAIGWLLVRHLLLRPLERIQRAISAYQPGDRPLALAPVRSPAHEIDALAQSFDTMTQTVAGHEADLEAALLRQVLLVREVHHRVKNNLQVVSSLLNIHARGATDDSAASAYAAIQRRVDALAIVHRNHYAELEDNRGVALRPLVSELAANLRASAPRDAAGVQILHDVDPVHVSQDVAVSIAFLVTEVAEFGMLCGASAISISIERQPPAAARLAIEADNPGGGPACDQALIDRFDRVIAGLARQLRSALEHDVGQGLYAVVVPVVPDIDAAGDQAPAEPRA
ncbi:MAG: sensor histidine kinase [Sphingomonas sp.]